MLPTPRALAALPAWSRLAQLAGPSICALAVSPNFASDHTIWAGSDNGLFVSTDGTARWVRQRLPSGGPVCSLLVADHTVLAASDRLFLSSDGGQSWKASPLSFSPAALGASPRGAVLIAASNQGTVARSTDGGRTWSNVADWQQGVPPAGHFIVYGIAFATATTVLIATGDGVFRSNDAGNTWHWSNNGLPTVSDLDPATGKRFRRVPAVVGIATGSTGAIVAALQMGPGGRLYRLQNGGNTWSLLSPLPGRPTVLVGGPHGTIALGTHDAGVFTSADGGSSWRAAPDLPDDDVAAVAFERVPTGSSLVVGTSYDGIFRLSSGRWLPSFRGLPQTDPVLSLLVRHRGRTIWAGTIAGIYLSRNGGRSWQAADSGLPGERSTVALAPLPHGAVLAGTSNGLFDRHARSWQATGPRLTRGLAVWSVATAARPSIRMAAGTENGFFGSVDGGKSWRAEVAGAMYVSRIAFDRRGMYFLDNGELNRVESGRLSSVAQMVGGQSIGDFAVIGRRVAMTAANGVYLRDGRGTRRVLRADLGSGAMIVPIGGRDLFVSGDAGLYRSRDGGLAWQKVAVPHSARVLAVAGRAGNVVVSLDGLGLWRYAG